MKISPRVGVPVVVLVCAFAATATAQVQHVMAVPAVQEKSAPKSDRDLKASAIPFIAVYHASGPADIAAGNRAPVMNVGRSAVSFANAPLTSASVNVAAMDNAVALSSPDYALPSAPTNTAMAPADTHTTVPEPGSLCLIGAGVSGALLLRRRVKPA